MKFYNSLTRKKEDLRPLKKKSVGIYTCGPTVYDFAHLGNLRSYIFADVLRRSLEFLGYKVKQVMNITDVGHLTSDADTGEDKMEVAKAREGKTGWDIAKFYTEAFLTDAKKLNLKKPDELPRATAHIKEQIDIIRQLEKNGFTYLTSDGIYFDTSKFKNYDQLSGQKREEMEAGARVEVNQEKRSPWNFVLWKFSPKDKKRDMEWESPWGVGFPGWHIECSAMSRKYLGQPFDIHTGGVDHLPIHHTNEIAQSEAAYHKPLANFWLHGEFLLVNGGRMGKSQGNLITIKELEEKGFNPLAYRYFVLGAHYRSKLNFTWEALAAAQNALFSLYDAARDWPKPRDGAEQYEKKFQEFLEDDLNTPGALALVWELVKSNEKESAKAATMLRFDQVLGLDLKKYVAKKIKVPSNVQKLVALREEARIKKDFARADELRRKIKDIGFLIEDSTSGVKVREKH